MMTLLVIDMQVGSFDAATPQHDANGVVSRINRLAAAVRKSGGVVVFVQHDGPPGDDFAPFTKGWAILGSLERDPSDRSVRKTLNDAFFGTSLQSDLEELGAGRVLVAGWATDMCVDATVRSAAVLGFEVVVVEDAHTVTDRPHLNAERIIEHHHWIWQNLFAPHPVSLAGEARI